MSARASCKFVLPKEMYPFFLWIGENIVEKYISANPVCGTNIQPPSVKNGIVVSMPIKFSKKFHRGIYPNKIHVKDTIAVPTR